MIPHNPPFTSNHLISSSRLVSFCCSLFFFHSSFPLFLTDKEKEECALLSMSFHPAHSFHILLLTLTLSLLWPPALTPSCCGVKKKFNIRMQSSRFLFSLFLLSIFTVCHHHQREIFLLLLIFLSFTNLLLHTVVVIRCKEMHVILPPAFVTSLTYHSFILPSTVEVVLDV